MDSNAASLEMMEKFWTDWFTTVGKAQARAAASMRPGGRAPDAAEVEDGARIAGAGPMPFLTPEAMRQFQGAFLEALSRYCDDYMRSPQFIAVMKQSLDNALTFRQQVNEFIDGAAASGFGPPGGKPVDRAVIVDAIRETERKLRDHIDTLSSRLDRLEERLDRRSER